jgi:TolB-like protein
MVGHFYTFRIARRTVATGLFSLLATSLTSNPLDAAENVPEGLKVATLPLQSSSVEPSVTEVLDELLVVEFAKRSTFKVISPSDVNAMLGLERLKDLVSCDATACAAELGGALGSDYLLTGKLNKLDGEFYLTLSLMDVRKQDVVGRGIARGKAGDTRPADLITLAVSSLLEQQEDSKRDSDGRSAGQQGTLNTIGKLTWAPCPIGQLTGGTGCTGTPRRVSAREARGLCAPPWSLPTLEDFMELLGPCKQLSPDGALACRPCEAVPECASVLPGTGLYWTLTPKGKDYHWFVDLESGVVDFGSHSFLARCVQRPDSAALKK